MNMVSRLNFLLFKLIGFYEEVEDEDDVVVETGTVGGKGHVIQSTG